MQELQFGWVLRLNVVHCFRSGLTWFSQGFYLYYSSLCVVLSSPRPASRPCPWYLCIWTHQGPGLPSFAHRWAAHQDRDGKKGSSLLLFPMGINPVMELDYHLNPILSLDQMEVSESAPCSFSLHNKLNLNETNCMYFLKLSNLVTHISFSLLFYVFFCIFLD